MRRAAIFDLDGTLIHSESAERTFFFHLLGNGGISPKDILQMVPALWRTKFNLHRMIIADKHYLRGKSVEKFREVAARFFEPRVEKLVFDRMKEQIEKHRQAGDVLLILSGTIDVIANCFVRELRLDGARAINLDIKNGKYTGRVNGVVPYGFGKLEVLRELRRTYKFDQNHTTLYANIYSDRYVMNAVEEPVAVNPDKRLRRYAERNNWKVIQAERGILTPS